MASISRQTLRLASAIKPCIQRNLGSSAILAKAAASDPIQGLFVEKIREYATKKKSAGGKLVDSTPEIEANLKNELDRVAKMYGGGAGVDMTKFPDLKWQDPALESLELGAAK